ncbi:MAG TPA: hypothetical protein VKA47_01785 [Solirubrobacterales bacterium]|nr:hypothetical protein [Solirubrobacterales bacterium]
MPEFSGGWLAGAWALVLLAMALAIGGFANSFTAVRDAVEPSFGSMAWTVPVLIDVGVAVFRVIRRWMILQEERSYERANARWWARKEAKWDLQDTYGPLLWRVRAPRRARGLYRWGHHTASAGSDPHVAVAPNPAPTTPRVGDIGHNAVPEAPARQAGARHHMTGLVAVSLLAHAVPGAACRPPVRGRGPVAGAVIRAVRA